MGDSSEWMTVKEAAELSGYHPVYLRMLIRRGSILAEKREGRWRVSRQSLVDYRRLAESKGHKSYGPRREA